MSFAMFHADLAKRRLKSERRRALFPRSEADTPPTRAIKRGISSPNWPITMHMYKYVCI